MTIGIERVFALFFAAVVLGAAAGSAGAATLKPWRHGTLDAKSDAGILFMIDQGFAEKQGLKLQIVQFHNDIVEIQALLAGDLDSYESSPGSAILAASRGADVKIIGCNWPVLPHALFVAKDIKSVADLKGKTIAVSAPGSLPDIFARAVLNQHHVPVSDVHFANLGNDPDRYKAVVAGIAQATVVSRQFEPVAEKPGRHAPGLGPGGHAERCPPVHHGHRQDPGGAARRCDPLCRGRRYLGPALCRRAPRRGAEADGQLTHEQAGRSARRAISTTGPSTATRSIRTWRSRLPSSNTWKRSW